MSLNSGGVAIKELRSQIGEFISRYCEDFTDARLGEFLGLSVGRVLLKEGLLGRKWRAAANDGQLHHIADWLKASIINDDGWLANVDAHGRPKKLMKFASIDQITQEADKAMLKAAQRLSSVKLAEGDEELYAELDDGYHIVRLLTPAALDRESAQMQHCIGDGAYDSRLDDDQLFYLSLRDASGKAHVTMEVQGDTLIQLQGKQNEAPVRKYIDRLIPFMKKHRLKVDLPVRFLQHVVDDSGHWHPIDALPDGLTVGGSLHLEGCNISSLPDGLSVGGSLFLKNTKIRSLPEGLSVGHHLDLTNRPITSLPRGLSVGWNIYLTDTKIRSLPEGLSVRGDLCLRGSSITSLPKGLSVGGILDLTNTNLSAIPDDVSVGQSLLLDGTAVTSLPDGLSVRGALSLRGLRIEKLPDDLSVDGYLDIRGTLITRIPKGVSVRGKVLSDSPLIERPSNMVFG